MHARGILIGIAFAAALGAAVRAEDFPKPYSPPCTERENVFSFTEKPAVKLVAKDRYRISFAVKGNCDVTVALVDKEGGVVRHLASGVLGPNAPAPFRKSSLSQKIVWDGKDDLGEYEKDPGALSVRVSLGVKHVYDKLFLGSSPKCLPGYVWGIVAAPDGAYVFCKGNGSHGHVAVRKFDHDGKYVMSLVPPPANLSESRLAGMGYLEYEKGKRSIHSPDILETTGRDGYVLPGVNGKSVADMQPALADNRLFFCNAGSNLLVGKVFSSRLFYIYADGSTDVKGLDGKTFVHGSHPKPRLAASPDGKLIYMTGMEGEHAVFRCSALGDDKAVTFVGDPKRPGSDAQHLNGPTGIDCDAQGRVYVADSRNNRVQIFSPEGKFLKSIPADVADVVRIHRKTGAVYVLHKTRIRGKSVGRLTRFSAFPELKDEVHRDEMLAAVMAVDSWTPKPRIWMAGHGSTVNTAGAHGSGPSVTIWEDDGKSFRKVADFDEEAAKEEGDRHIGRWGGQWVGPGGKVIGDPTRGRFYVNNRHVFDPKTGARTGHLRIPAFSYDDIAVDKRGYIHVHLNPGHDAKGVLRVEPADRPRKETSRNGSTDMVYDCREVPYDYGIEVRPRYAPVAAGGLPVRDQGGPNGFQDGLGVNMRGDIAVESKIWYVPRMEDVGFNLAYQGTMQKKALGIYGGDPTGVRQAHAAFLRHFQDLEKRGEQVYTIRRRPGSPLAGGTVWVHDRTGELRGEDCTVVGGQIIDGVMIDEDGKLYLVNNRIRMIGDKPFLAGRGGRFGIPQTKWSYSPNTGTMIKSDGGRVLIQEDRAAIPMESLPKRPADLWKGRRCWVDGAEWLYAGASPITFGGCACPAQRLHTDWFKRSYVPEAYRHSVALLDTGGNLIAHIGRYGNYDSGFGPDSRIPVGDDGIALFQPRYIGGTDDYVCFSDWGERFVLLKVDYHAQETAPVQ
jgi:hypothetical protein